VEPCQAIGKVGKTGNTEAAHLHFEARTGPPGVQFAGMSYFTDEATKEEKRNYRWWRLSGDFLHFDPMDLFKYGANLMQTP
jgi:murein DD-endopeptidase MepM/ murein hydrolase activator NlpD